jgi:hypothetical protein
MKEKVRISYRDLELFFLFFLSLILIYTILVRIKLT